jgi:hypothetical protein
MYKITNVKGTIILHLLEDVVIKQALEQWSDSSWRALCCCLNSVWTQGFVMWLIQNKLLFNLKLFYSSLISKSQIIWNTLKLQQTRIWWSGTSDSTASANEGALVKKQIVAALPDQNWRLPAGPEWAPCHGPWSQSAILCWYDQKYVYLFPTCNGNVCTHSIMMMVSKLNEDVSNSKHVRWSM